MKSLFAILTAGFVLLGAVAGSAFACPYEKDVTASTPTSTSTNQTVIDEG
jgi:hypothetical protein